MEVALFASLREAAGLDRLEIQAGEADTVGDILARLFELHPSLRDRVLDETGGLRDGVSVFLQGRNIRLFQELETPLGNGKRLALFPHVAGG